MAGVDTRHSEGEYNRAIPSFSDVLFKNINNCARQSKIDGQFQYYKEIIIIDLFGDKGGRLKNFCVYCVNI